MADFPTFNDLFRIARDEALGRNPKLSRDAIERDGMDANVIVAAAVAAADEVVGQIVDLEAGLFLDSATGQKLERLVYDRYGLIKKAASPAIGSVTFSLVAANPTAFTINAGTVLQTASGVQFTTTDPAVTFASGATSVSVAVRSTLAGASQQARANTITSIVSQITGAPATLTVTNPAATAGADDAETDDSLRNRARQFFVNARRATLGAIESGALAVAGVRSATAFEVLDAQGNPARLVELVISDAFTEALVNTGVNPASYQTQAQTLAASVFAGLSDVRAAGIYVRVVVAQVKLRPVQLALTFTSTADVVAAAASARAAVVGYVNSLPPGAPFVRTSAVAALRSVPGLVVSGGEVVSPAGDVQPASLEVLRSSMALVSAFSASAITS